MLHGMEKSFNRTIHKTYAIQLEYGKKRYLFQSTDHAVIRKMRRRNDFNIFSWSINSSLRVFTTAKATPQSARRTLSRLTGVPISKLIYNALEDDYCAITYTIVTPKKVPESK